MSFIFFNEDRKQSIESVEFFFFLYDFYVYLLEKTNPKNNAMNQFVYAIKGYYHWQFYKTQNYVNSHQFLKIIDDFYFALEAFYEESEPGNLRFLSDDQFHQIVKDALIRV